MKCDGCKKNEATLVLHMIANGQVATRSLCMDCAKKAHEEMAQAFSTMGMTLSGMDELGAAAPREELHVPRMICAACRTAYENIDHDTVFGCPQCYQAFHERVVSYLSGLKGPEQRPETVQAISMEPVPMTENDLKEQLSEALKAEDYEQAASLRDRLKELSRPQEGAAGEADE